MRIEGWVDHLLDANYSKKRDRRNSLTNLSEAGGILACGEVKQLCVFGAGRAETERSKK